MTADALIKSENLNKLTLSPEERALASDFFAFIREGEKILDQYDLSGTEPMVHLAPPENILREDAAEQKFSREDLLKGAPEQHNGYWQVPRLVE
jgi:aspartyl/glutamyl-tRNA(Asn/Gln) amidotransferase C subunit